MPFLSSNGGKLRTNLSSSLNKAVDAVGVTQSNISKSIQKLESQLAVLLFDRHPRDVDIQIYASTGRFEDLKHGLDNHSYDCLLYDVGELHTLYDPDNYEVIPLLQGPIYVVANHDHPIHQQTPVLDHLFKCKGGLPPIPQRYIRHFPPQFQTFLLNSNKPDFEVTDLPHALELTVQNGLITITLAAGDLHWDEWQQRALTAIELAFTIRSDIGL